MTQNIKRIYCMMLNRNWNIISIAMTTDYVVKITGKVNGAKYECYDSYNLRNLKKMMNEDIKAIYIGICKHGRTATITPLKSGDVGVNISLFTPDSWDWSYILKPCYNQENID